MTGPVLTFRRLTGGGREGLAVLDIVSGPGDACATCFFTRATAPEAARAALGEVLAETSVNGAPILTVPRQQAARLGPVAEAEPALMAGRNVAIATRNGEPAGTVLDWLRWHHDRFGMTGAVIFERAPPDAERAEWQALARALAQEEMDMRVVVVHAPLPLGDPALPAESHPFCVPEAPGKDRMGRPAPDPWRAPLYEMSIFDIARRRFLTEARAIASLDLHDLLRPVPRLPSPFELAARAPGHVIELVGQHAYPWRVRKGRPPGFGDHVCVQFDRPQFRRRWCVAPGGMPEGAVLKCLRVGGMRAVQQYPFYRCMAVRHPVESVGRIVPKSSLIESPDLVALAEGPLSARPVRAPQVALASHDPSGNRTAIVTTMKNEGPFILEWLAYHRAIGVRDFLVYTNDCTDGTDAFFDLLQEKGIVRHRDNPFREMGLKPQHAALQAAENEEVIRAADWIICMDVDEYINIKAGAGRLENLYAAVGDANMISCTWRLFGNADIDEFREDFTIAQFDRCAPEFAPKPHQAWGFKTLFRNIGIFKKLGVHRPKGLQPQLWDRIRWVNGSGRPMPQHEYRNAWRSTTQTWGYDLVALNHYAVRNAESFLVKRDRGRVNHVDRDQGLAYWFRMNNNAERDTSIQRMIPAMKAEFDRLMADSDIAAQHRACIAAHRARIAQLKADPAQLKFYRELSGERMKRLSRMHRHFGANVFLRGPEAIPDEVVWGDHDDDYFFTVERGETRH